MKYPYPALNMYLKSMLGSTDLVNRWYESPNRAFDSRTPLEWIEAGGDTRAKVYKYVLAQTHDYIPQ